MSVVVLENLMLAVVALDVRLMSLAIRSSQCSMARVAAFCWAPLRTEKPFFSEYGNHEAVVGKP